MGMQGKRAYLDCCECGGNCRSGCCLAIDHSNPLYEPRGTPKNIPFTISAPGCPQLDGYSGTLFCGGATPAVYGPCGICASCIAEESFNILSKKWTALGPMCVPDTCSIILCFGLYCRDSETSDTSQETCCRKMKLYIGATEHIVGEETGLPANGDCDFFKIVSPTSCVCSEDPEAFPAVVFPLDLSIFCEGTFASGPCAGRPDCCYEFASCDLTGAELII